MTIDELQAKIMRTTPTSFMAMNGAESGILGSANGSQFVQELQRAAIEFTHSYKTADADTIKQARKLVTAKILVAQTMGAMSEKTADDLLDEIAELMKEKN